MIKRRIQIDVFNMERYLSFVCLFFFFVGNVDRIQCKLSQQSKNF